MRVKTASSARRRSLHKLHKLHNSNYSTMLRTIPPASVVIPEGFRAFINPLGTAYLVPVEPQQPIAIALVLSGIEKELGGQS